MQKYTSGSRAGRLQRENGLYLNQGDYIYNNTTAFNERKVAEKTQQLILNANVPLSDLRDVRTTTNGASISQQGAEYRLRGSSTNNSVARLQSTQRGNYISGNVLESGMGLRIPTLPTGDATIKAGYWKGNTGMYFRFDSNGKWVVVENGGTIVEEKHQDDWNIDTLRGNKDDTNNPSTAEFNIGNGHVIQIPFVYYGYGPVLFEVGLEQPDGQYLLLPVHSFNRKDAITIDEPNLPITIEVDSGTTGQQLDCFVGGRQISTFGKQQGVSRDVGSYRLQQSVGGTFEPLISFRHKTGWKNIIVRLSSLSIISDLDLVWRIRTGGSLTGASWGAPTDYTASEVATEWDISATESSGGHVIKHDLADGGNKNTLTAANIPERVVYEENITTLEARSITGQSATVTSHLEVDELQ